MRSLFALILAFSFLAGESFAETWVPERRLVVTRDVDFFGSDLQNLFDTTLDACERACLSDPQCKAFTFNARSNACFPKSSVSDQKPYDGAISAQVVETEQTVLAITRQRADDLSFLGEGDLSAALKQAQEIGATHPAGQWDVEALLQAATDRRAGGDVLNAMRWMGAAVSKSDASDQWLEYARLSEAIKTSKGAEARKYLTRALSASINAYLRAKSKAERAGALGEMAILLERSRRGRDMIPALRLAQDIQPRVDAASLLEQAIAKYGFRITVHRVDNESASPRICAEFSEPLVKVGVDYSMFLKLPDQSMAVQAEGNQICLDGAEHGKRYHVTFRQGLPAASGEKLHKNVNLALYVRDRSPSARFPGRAYVLPKSVEAALPIETVNLDRVDLKLRRVSDRNLLRAFQDSYFGKSLSYWEDQNFASDVAEEVWTGTGEVQNILNQNITTRLPMGDVLAAMPTGIYALTARVQGVDVYDDAGATQWFVLSDLGLTTLSGTDGLHVFVRSLAMATAKRGVKLTLVSRSNRPIATIETDSTGYGHFEAGLMRGSGSAAPALVVAEDGAEDFGFLSLTDPAFDLSDRGVQGRAPAQAIDAFLATDRAAYRVGETIRATVLARDSSAKAITGLPIVAILYRPDGVEYARHLSANDVAGGHVFNLPIGETAPRGTWRLEIKADPEAPTLTSQTLLIEDFLPERIDFAIELPSGDLRVTDKPPLNIEAKYLFGAPGANLTVEGEVSLRAADELPGFPGFRFGRYDERFDPRTRYLEQGKTNAKGQATLALNLPDAQDVARPLVANVVVRIAEGSGRPVERELQKLVAPVTPVIGIKQMFDGVVPEKGEAAFQILGLDTQLAPTDMRVRWTLNKVETRYQWYRQYGNWNWEPITRRIRIASEEASLGSVPLVLSEAVDWGRYELVVERLDGAYVAAARDFYAGWYAPADSSSTPDTLEVSLDKPNYKKGESARLRIVSRYSGTALVSVASNKLIERHAIEVSEGENLIPLTVTEAWGAGAYVTASVIRAMNAAVGQNPSRALGLAYAAIDPADKQLSVKIETSSQAMPRGTLEARLNVTGITAGETAYVTVAAVDVGILNLTRFQSPDPSTHYFGQRRLGVELRDVYGRLIDGLNGAMGQVRSGGDASNSMRMNSAPPTEDLVAYFSGPLDVDADGQVAVSFDLPAFNGTVRLMAIAWSDTAIGQSSTDVIVRDPVVVTASAPRFMSPGDTSRLLVEFVHVDGPAGRMGLDVTTDGVVLDAASVPSGLTLDENGTARLSLPITAAEVGDHQIDVVLTTPDGKQLTKTLVLGVRQNDPVISTTRRFSLGAGDTFTLDDNVFADLNAGTARAILSAGPLAKLDAPGLLSALDRYPYGCTEQVTSQAMPLLYLNQVAQVLGLGDREKIQARVDQAIDQVMIRQSSNGAFGLWRAESGDFWLDAYVSDFLSRARSEGFKIPDLAFRLAMDNLRNRINYAPDFDEDGGDIAYALMVLAREGAAAMGDLRYYADVKAEAFTTPIGAAQLAAALAFYGDQTRADAMFARAARMLAGRMGDDAAVWRADYGSNLRDAAAVLTLAAEAGTRVIDKDLLADRIAGTKRGMSTQESVWSLLAARALSSDSISSNLTVDGVPLTGPMVRVLDNQTDGRAMAIRNEGANPTDITLTTIGVPTHAPEQSGYGYRIDRAYFTMEGAVADDAIRMGDRYVAVLTVTPFENAEARLMVNDPLPAGFEIDNPNLLRSGDIKAMDWLKSVETEHTEFRADRFLAAVDWRGSTPFRLAYVVRAVSPGQFHHSAASVEDMYRPQFRAISATGRIIITE